MKTFNLAAKIQGCSFILSICGICGLFTGCRAIEFSQTQEGKTTRVRMVQAFTTTDAYTCELTPVSARLTAVKSGIDGKALGVAAGVAAKTLVTP